MIDWKPESIEAADKAYHENMSNDDSYDFWRIVLDAAFKVQWPGASSLNQVLFIAEAFGRADALGKAAEYLDSIQHTETANLIRALRDGE